MEYLVVLIAYFIIARFVVGDILFSEGTIGFFHDWYIGPYPEMMFDYSKGGLYLWDPQSGSVPYSVDWVIRVLSLPFSFVGGEIYSKAIIVISLTLSGFTSFYLGRTLKLNTYVSFLAGVIYIFSPIIFTRIVAGYTYYLIGYALAPAVLSAFLKGYEKQNKKMFIVAGLLTALAIIQLQFLVMIFVVLLVFTLTKYKNIRVGFTGLCIVLGICFFITLIPIVLSQIIIPTGTSTFNPEEIYGELEELPVASNLIESFRMLGYGLHPYSYLNLGTSFDYVNLDNEVIPHWVFYANFIIPIAAFSTLLFRRDKYTISFAVISLIGLFIVKGPNPPFSEFFERFFPMGLFVFREVWHSMFLYGFAVTFLIAFLFDKISSIKMIRINTNTRVLNYSIILSVSILIIISNGYPLLLGNFAGYIQTFSFMPENKVVYDKYSFNDTFNTLVLPMFAPMKYDNLHLSGIDPNIAYSTNMIFPSDSAIGDIRHSTSDVALWLMSLMIHEKTDNIGSLLTAFGIKYIILRENFESEFLKFVAQGRDSETKEKWDSFDAESFLDRQKDLVRTENFSGYKIYENTNNSSKLFVPKVRIGGLSSFDDLLLFSKAAPLSEFAAYSSRSDSDSISISESTHQANLDSSNFIPLSPYVGTEDPANGWTSNLDAFAYNHILSSRINNGIFALRPGSQISFQLPLQNEGYDNVTLWAKVLEWNKGGEVDININGNTSHISLFSDTERMRAIPLYTANDEDYVDISIVNKYGANYFEGIYTEQYEEVRKPSEQFNGNLSEEMSLNKFMTESIEVDDLNLIYNPSFSPNMQALGVPEGYIDRLKSCEVIFTCSLNRTDSWEEDSTSFQVSTTSANNNSWSWIYTNPISIESRIRYEFVSHLKLNEFARDSHIVIEGFNSNTRIWQQLKQCPSAVNGPTDWNQYICHINIPKDFIAMRIGLNGGYSSSEGQKAETRFDGLYLTPIGGEWSTRDESNLKKIGRNLSGSEESKGPRVLGSSKINPSLWVTNITSNGPFTLAFAEPYDSAWQAKVYIDGKEVEVVDSMLLYDSINSFMINHGGHTEIIIKNIRQDWFDAGLVISALSVATCLFLALSLWKRSPLEYRKKA